MLTSAERLRFAFLLSAGAGALVLRDALAKAVAPKSAIARSRSAAAAFESEFLRGVSFATETLHIEAQLGMPVETPRALVLLCHGIGERFSFWRQVQHLLAANGFGSLIFHYSGYGRSSGPFTPENVDASARAAYAYLQRVAPGVPVFVFGTSLGSAVAAQVAAALEPAGLIVAQGFTTLREAAACVLRKLLLPAAVSRLMPDVWRNTEAVAAARCPVLIVHGAADELFPVAMGEELFRSAAARRDCLQTLLTPAGFEHSDPMLGFKVEAYWQPILEFLRANAPGTP